MSATLKDVPGEGRSWQRIGRTVHVSPVADRGHADGNREAALLIAQISDLHLKPNGTLLFGAVDAYGLATEAIARIEGMEPRPDAVLITGDLANDGTDDDYGAVAELIPRLSMPVFAVPGNHDRRGGLRRIFATGDYLPPTGRLCYAAEIGELRLIGLDSLVEGEAHGEVGREQLDWLDTTLAERRGAPTLVMVHHPPFRTGIGFMDSIGLRDAEDLAAVIGRHPQVERVLAGHVHRVIEARFAGTIALACPGTAHQVHLQLRADGPAAWTAEPPAVLLHWWNGERLVTHLAPVRGHEPGGAFSDPHTRTQ